MNFFASRCVSIVSSCPPLNPSSSVIWRWLADRSDEKAVCVCVNLLTGHDWVNTRAIADESEGAGHFTCVCGYNASVSRVVSQQDMMCLQTHKNLKIETDFF